MKKIFNTKDVADMLGVTNRTVQNYIRNGLIHASIRLPSGIHKFSEHDMQAIRSRFMENNTNGNMEL